MKKVISLFLVLVMCLYLCACGKSEAVKNVEALIDAIGNVTTESGEAISSAEKAYEALSEEEKIQVKNADLLSSARVSLVEVTFASLDEITVESAPTILAAEALYESLTEEEKNAVTNYDILTAAKSSLDAAYFEQFRLSLVGEWVQIGEPFEITLKTDGSASLRTSSGEQLICDWVLSEDKQCVEFIGHICFELNISHIFEYISLVNPLDISNLGIGTFVKKEEEKALFDQYFTEVELTTENMGEYIGEPIFLGKEVNEWGEEQESGIYYFKSTAYELGLIYVAVGEDYAVDGIWGIPFLPESSYSAPSIHRIKGTMYFISSEYVSNAKLVPESNARVITLTDGSNIVTYMDIYTYGLPVNGIVF